MLKKYLLNILIMNNLSSNDFALIKSIADRYQALFDVNQAQRSALVLDLVVVQKRSTLDLKALLESDESSFAHDIFGIIRHLDRSDGTFNRSFVPLSKHN